MKTEPDTYSWDDLVRDTKKNGSEEWSGVRNYQARNTMQQMSVGDEVFVYHSGKERAIVGIGTVMKIAHPDSTDMTGMWECVDVAAVKQMKRPITLQEIKLIPALQNMVLVKNSRLSVQPVQSQEWTEILKMSGL